MLVSLVLALSAAASEPDEAAEALFASFVSEFGALDPPMEPFAFSYVENFQAIPDPAVIRARTELFVRTRAALRRIDRRSLAPELRYQYDTLAWELGFGLRRLLLEARLDPGTEVGPAGLYDLPDGRRWYRLYLQRWASADVTPRRLQALGNADVERITAEIAALQTELGYEGRDDAFREALNGPGAWQTDEEALQASFRALRDRVGLHLGDAFEPREVPEVQIAPWEGATKDTPPGYWDAGTFHYTFFEGRFPVRTTEWLFLHEAIPGHHYQSTIEGQPPLLELFWYPGYSEGWGAYAEDLGKDVGCFVDPWQYLGKWEWDLVRSARVVIDVGIHDQGWTRDEALAWWHAHLRNQDGIAEREIDRIIRWPAQVVSYKVGEHAILYLRAFAEEQLGPSFDLRRFHTWVLMRGSIPLPVLDEAVRDAVLSARRTRPDSARAP